MSRSRNTDALVRGTLFTAALGLFFLLILFPLVSLNRYAVREGFGVFWDRLKNPDAIAALRLKYADIRQKQKKTFGRDIKEVAHGG